MNFAAGYGSGGPHPGSGSYGSGIRRTSLEMLPDSAVSDAPDPVPEPAWSVPPISCHESGNPDFPLYIQLGPAAGHRGNQGRFFLSM
jgi:hypothetical protein